MSSARPEASTARLFLALLPGAALRAAVGRHAQTWRWPGEAVRYAPGDWHVTLHFIGAEPRARMQELQAALDVPFHPFDLRFGEPAVWPRGLAVLLPLAVPQGLQDLHDALGRQLRRLGLRTDERPYRPHLTLARSASGAVPPGQWPAWGWHAGSYVLMESSGQAADRYRIVQRYGPDGAEDELLA